MRENATSVCPLGAGCTAPAEWPMAVTTDASHAFIGDPVFDRVELMYLDPPRGSLVPSFLTDAIAGVRMEAWASLDDRDDLLFLAAKVGQQIDLAQPPQVPEHVRRARMCNAAEDLEAIAGAVDGCFGGDATGDVIADCYEAAGVHHVATSLLEAVSGYLVEPPEEP